MGYFNVVYEVIHLNKLKKETNFFYNQNFTGKFINNFFIDLINFIFHFLIYKTSH